MKQVLTGEQVEQAIERLCKAVIAELPDDSPIAVIGIRTRGETLAQRIVDRIEALKTKNNVHHGVLDITFYRDDLSRRRGAPLVRATEIDFDLDDTWVLLVDDVLQTGRSIRAALDAIHDFGRPKVIRLAVLIDRGGRELPDLRMVRHEPALLERIHYAEGLFRPLLQLSRSNLPHGAGEHRPPTGSAQHHLIFANGLAGPPQRLANGLQ